jgi:hypothetical protein
VPHLTLDLDPELDPDPHSSKRLDPDPKHSFLEHISTKKISRRNMAENFFDQDPDADVLKNRIRNRSKTKKVKICKKEEKI